MFALVELVDGKSLAQPRLNFVKQNSIIIPIQSVEIMSGLDPPGLPRIRVPNDKPSVVF